MACKEELPQIPNITSQAEQQIDLQHGRQGTKSDGGIDLREPTSPTLSSSVESTVSRILEIHKALPPCTLFIVYTGTGDPCEVGRLQKMRQQFQKEFKVKRWDQLSVKWTDEEEQALKRAVEKARQGMAFMCIK